MIEQSQRKINILNLLSAGGIGGIEVLLRDVAEISRCTHTFAFLRGEGVIYNQLIETGYDIFCEKSCLKISPTVARTFCRAARNVDIIVIHHDDPFLQMYYLLLKYVFPRKIFISMIHHCYTPEIDHQDYSELKKAVQRFLISEVIRISDRLIFVSRAGHDSYAGVFDFRGKKCDIVYNGIGRDMFLSNQNPDKHVPDMIHIAYVGRLVPIKGVDQLLDALAGLKDKYHFTLDIVGDGKARKLLEEQTQELGLDGCVTFHGLQTNVRPFLNKADIFVYPSRTEVFGLAIVEAMAHQCICVANNVGGIPEIIHDDVNGFLNVDNTTEGLCDKISEAVSAMYHTAKRDELIQGAAQTAAMFTIDRTVDGLDAIFEGVMNNG